MELIQQGVAPHASLPWWCGRWMCHTCNPVTIFDLGPEDAPEVKLGTEAGRAGEVAFYLCPVCTQVVVRYEQPVVRAEADAEPLPARSGRVALQQVRQS